MTNFTLHLGDCLESLRGMADNSVHSVVCDPPYGLSDHAEKDIRACMAAWLAGDEYLHSKKGFMGKTWDSFVPGPEVWREVFRVLKPGGYVLAFASTRTDDLMSMAMRLAGFRKHPFVGWITGSGFPKAANLSKAFDREAGVEREIVSAGKAVKRMIPGADQNETGSWIKDNGREYVPTVSAPATPAAKQWDGWAYGLQSLKPAIEPCLMFQKPHEGRMTDNVLQHGTGAINVDGCRVGVSADDDIHAKNPNTKGGFGHAGASVYGDSAGAPAYNPAAGRWPANLILQDDPSVLAGFPESKSGGVNGVRKGGENNCMSGGNQPRVYTDGRAPDTGSAARFFKQVQAEPEDIAAARFMYCAKASRADRNAGLQDPGPQFKHGTTLRKVENTATKGNTHMCVKPTDLMAYLVRLVTPPGGTVLDPFMGSGSTGKACIREGFNFIGCELDPEYIAIARARIEHELALVTAANAPKLQADLFALP